jgi:hypothetical protein
MRRKKISAALTKVARDVHDSEEFIAHIGAVADRYRSEYALATGPRGREVRQALKRFRNSTATLSGWLMAAHAKPTSLEFAALTQLGAAMQSAPNQMLASSAGIVAWLRQAEDAAAAAEAQLSNKRGMQAPRLAAEALRATFERHGVKWSTQVTQRTTGNAVRLLCAIAKGNGDELTPERAREVLVAVTRRVK